MIAEPQPFHLTVARVEQPTPRMRAISLTAPALAGFTSLPGQDVSLAFTRDDGSVVRRRYSIRRLETERRMLEINVVMHGDGPGRRWAERADAGLAIDAIAPRGKITLARDAPWHLFAGDATAVPAAFAMMEALAASVPVFGFFLVDDSKEQQVVGGDGHQRVIQWQYPEGDEVGGRILAGAIENTSFPSSAGHAYIAGEVALVSELKALLLAYRWSDEQISAKAYWNRGRPNAGHGEPEKKA